MEAVMYLSKVKIKGVGCRNPYEIHRELWRLFPEARDAERDFLFRIDRTGYTGAHILMQSLRPPQGKSENAEVVDWKKYKFAPQEAQQLRFMLLANPTKKIDDASGRLNEKGDIKKCRVPLVKEEEQRQWIFRKFNSIAQIEALYIDPRRPFYFRKKGRAGKIQPILYQGILRVEDVTLFLKMVQQGIGPAKAFGCGLLSLARA